MVVLKPCIACRRSNRPLNGGKSYKNPGGLLIGILGGAVPPDSPNPDPISHQKCDFPLLYSELASIKSILVFRPGGSHI